MDKIKVDVIEKYEANRMTMAVLPYKYGKNVMAQVLECENEFIVKRRPMEVIDRSCRYYGSSYEGRKDGTRELMGITHKPPIVVDPVSTIFLFPTTSSSRPQCAWLSHIYIQHYTSTDLDDTKVIFTTGKEITLPVSVSSFENQLFRTAQLRTIISSRVEEEHRKMNMLLLPREKETNSLYEHIIRELSKK
ncbi:competence protein ComK [Metabacillus herbersteinensis]|uniref:Competence protein ComK n=1 Tax=Metabacillus herbersteinensis TaxID=283816 RepID=A0ABV6GLJ9_9BACI